jgi:hypothetical protein
MKKIKEIKDFLIKFKKDLMDEKPLTEAEQLAFDIFKICLYDDNNLRYMNIDSVSKKYILSKTYISDNTVDNFIILDHLNYSLTIVNHQYKYDISMPEKTVNIMCDMFNEKVKEERSEMEKQILNNINESLEIVLNQLKNKLIVKK